ALMRLLHGRPLAERLAARSRERSAALLGRGIHPALTVISVGIDSAANTYLLRLVRGGEALDITVRDVSLHRDATEQAVSAELDRASRDPAVHGVLLLTPLPGKLDEGINMTPAGIAGDADADSVATVAGALSPVPGGVGTVTTALLLRNVLSAAEAQTGGG